MSESLYEVLGITASAAPQAVKRAYRTLITKQHPDKGGDVVAFEKIQKAYEILSDASQRAQYDATGATSRSIQDEFVAGFGWPSDTKVSSSTDGHDLKDQLMVHPTDSLTHSAGFEAWMRSRGGQATEVLTADTMAAEYGIVPGSFDAVPLPQGASAQQVVCTAAGPPAEVLRTERKPLPAALDWGQIFVHIQSAPINPADIYTAKTGGMYGSHHAKLPYVAGHDCAAKIAKVGPGVRHLNEGDWVIPLIPHMGTFATAAVWKAADVLRIPADVMPLQYCAMLREMLLAYCLLQQHGQLKPGDCVMLSAANSTVGQAVIQLCSTLRLRTVAIVRDCKQTEKWLKDLGATIVLSDRAHIRHELDALKFFAKPKLALDAVGGVLSARMSEALVEGGSMICYGALCGKAPAWPWQSWVFQEQKVCGFNLRSWLARNQSKVPHVMEMLGKLISNGLLKLAYTEYSGIDEFDEALDHALDEGKNTKILLIMSDLPTGIHA